MLTGSREKRSLAALRGLTGETLAFLCCRTTVNRPRRSLFVVHHIPRSLAFQALNNRFYESKTLSLSLLTTRSLWADPCNFLVIGNLNKNLQFLPILPTVAVLRSIQVCLAPRWLGPRMMLRPKLIQHPHPGSYREPNRANSRL